MGNNESKQNLPSSVKNSANFNFLSKLFQDHSTVNKDGFRIITESNFGKLFLGRNTQFTNLLYKHFLAITESNVDPRCNGEMQKHSFITGFDTLIKLEVQGQEMIGYYINMVFTEEYVSKIDMKQILQSAYGVYISLYSPDNEDTTNTLDDKALDALAASLLPNGKDAVTKDIIVRQIIRIYPKLFNNIHWWFLRSLSKLESPYPITLQHKKCPKIQLIKDGNSSMDSLLDEKTLWVLALSLTQEFFKNKTTKDDHLLVQWKMLYNSNEHGLSHNRFKHHCFSYRGPTVLVILLADKTKLVLSMGSEWKDSPKMYGDAATQLYQVYPEFKLLVENNIVLFNERSRGLPIGLVLGTNPSNPVVSLIDGLTLAKIHFRGLVEEKCVENIEVWGCAGNKAESDQKQQQKRQDKQAEQLQKVKLPGHWDENPDKSLLEMAGITTEHAQR